KAFVLYWALRELETRRNRGPLAERYGQLFQHVEIAAPISVGTFKAGHWPSTVPDSAVMEGRCGVWLGETLEQAQAALRACVDEAGRGDPFLAEHPPRLEFYGSRCDSAILELEHPFARAAGDVLRTIKP